MKMLITGGAGYIGSHAVRECLEKGHQVWVLDDLSKGHRKAVDSRAHFVQGNVGNYDLVSNLLKSNGIEGVMHFAGFIEVGESVKFPDKYHFNNVVNGVHLLRAIGDSGVKRMVFSSTAAVYGVPSVPHITEDQQMNPINPYGDSKMKMESAVKEAASKYGLSYAIFRYFNVAGAHPDGSLGEAHEPESHLIPRILLSIVNGKNDVSVYGDKYPTDDGTCVRDYVHVMDLVDAHILAITHIQPGTGDVFNLGSDRGFSVKEVIKTCEQITLRKLNVNIESPRAGDPAILVASSEKAKKNLGWKPQYSDLETIISHAWQWHLQNPKGFQ